MHTVCRSVLSERLSIVLQLCVGLFIVLLAQRGHGSDVDETPLPVKVVPAFPALRFQGWQEKLNGQPNPLRPVLITHAADRSNRLFVPTREGVVHVFANDVGSAVTRVFLDLTHRVEFSAAEGNGGVLGLAFHPLFATNGEFFVHYMAKEAEPTSVLSRFRVAQGSPQQADPDSEVELLRIAYPTRTALGGTLVFGPDGLLYMSVGIGGTSTDPGDAEAALNLQTLRGKILRIDVQAGANGQTYSIPAGNPYVGKKSRARPEIFAYGLSNVRGISFDRQTGVLWAADCGSAPQASTPAAIHHILRSKNSGAETPPVWDCSPEVGSAITGGVVYRGAEVPALTGHYLYAEESGGLIRGLEYEKNLKRVTSHRPIPTMGSMPIVSFGEDEAGEVYFVVQTPSGQAIWKLVSGTEDVTQTRPVHSTIVPLRPSRRVRTRLGLRHRPRSERLLLKEMECP